MSKPSYSPIQKWTLITTILASSLVFIDSTALNVAMATLQEDMGITGVQLLWVVNGYALFLSALLLAGGSLGDLYGRNKVFLIGLVIFSTSSLFCGLSNTPIQLIIGRCFQGIGGALLTPGSLSILSAHFEEDKRGKAIGLWSTFSALTAVVGPLLGGWLAGIGLWRVIFFLNVPLSFFVFYGIYSKVPESKSSAPKDLDLIGIVLVTLGLAGITFGLIESPKLGIQNPLVLTSLIGGTLMLIFFFLSQNNRTNAMMPLRLFSSPSFSGSNLLTFFIYGALSIIIFFLPLNLIQIQGYNEMIAGAAMLPIIFIISSISPFMGKVADKYGSRVPLVIGPIITGTGFLVFSLVGQTTSIMEYWWTFFPGYVLLGLGMGITVVPLTTSVMGAVSNDEIGIASGVNNTVSRASGVLFVALLGAVVLFTFKSNLINEISQLELDTSSVDTIVAESTNLAALKIPNELTSEMKVLVNTAKNDSFIQSFNLAVYFATILSYLGAVVAYFTIPQKNQKP